jgi:hypothetical protein
VSSVIKNALSNLNGVLDHLDQAVAETVRRTEEQETALYEAQAALNDNAALLPGTKPGITEENVDLFSRKLDTAIDRVERLLSEEG